MAADPNQFDKLAYLESIIQNIVDIITILEADGTIRYESPSITNVLGYLPDEMVGQNAFGFVHPDDYKRVFSLFAGKSAKKNAVEAVELRFRHKDGHWVYLECSAKNLLFDPHVRGVVVSSRDMAFHRDVELKMRLQSEALTASSNGILISERAGTILWVNPAFTAMTGYSYDEAVGKNPRILKSGEQSPKLYKELWETILAGKSWTGELINRRKDGTLYFEKQTITPVVGNDGGITHFIAIKRDVSEEKKLEAQFRQAQKMEAVGRLAGGVAHDFNNLLTVILGHSDLLLAKGWDDERLTSSLTEIRKAGVRAAALTRQLLAFSRKQVFQMKVHSLNEIVAGMDKMIRRLLGADIELVTLLGEDVDPVWIDAGQIEQVIMNLVVNARDAMPNGGKVVIETRKASVDAVLAGNGKHPGFVPGVYTVLKVQDTGTGISPEAKAHLFEPFFTTKEKGKGTGLGLATVYGIVKQSQGFIYAESEPGKGTEFLVYLPPSAEKPQNAAVAAVVELPCGQETVVIAEDEELVRGLAVQFLARQGYRVLEARNGLEALDAAARHEGSPIALLITDMVMPHMGGNELAEKFSANYPRIKIIFTSGYTDHGGVQSWLDRGCSFLQKPYTQAELLMMVREVLDKPQTPPLTRG
ncbi:MAG TPA: PAS domain S-box protein [Verrucomicrobiae bacterium]|jgi:PAS domain S-box-containing protein|nr:PAS domain S-box protein [Verrucomicrobiae bacterium]